GVIVTEIMKQIPEDSTFFVGNSMSIRDVDTFFMNTQKKVYVHANRGANGIDGVTSSALGASSTGRQVTLLLGDLSFYHDLNGLLAAKHYGLNMTVVCVNNNGGGIFSFLPQANDEKHFDKLFGTPLDINLQHAAEMYGGNYKLLKKPKELEGALRNSYNQKGLTVIEVQTNRRENESWHRHKWLSIERALEKVCEE